MIAPLLVALLLLSNAPNATPAGPSVAVTLDDLPGPEGSVVSNDPAALRQMTGRLLGHFRAHQVQVTAFVNESKLFRVQEMLQTLGIAERSLEPAESAGTGCRS